MLTKALMMSAMLLSHLVVAQEGKVFLKNASFEGEPGTTRGPEGWVSFGLETESPPFVQPGAFGCSTKPLRGNSYLGLVTRDNNTKESVGQLLDKPLKADTLYDFSICLATSRRYESPSRATGLMVNYSGQVRLLIWGINLEQEKKVLLAESPIVSNRDWVRYRFEIRPPGFDIQVVQLEAWYGTPNLMTNGNLLLDNCSPFIPKSIVSDANRVPERVLAPTSPKAQRLIELYNPSFELAPVYFLPFGWEDTAEEITTWARTHPFKLPRIRAVNGTAIQFAVGRYGASPPTQKKPQDGEHYISLLASELKKRQQVSQRLEGLLKQDSAYTFSLHMARSKAFWDDLTPWGKQVDFKNPLRLRIWGGSKNDHNIELLAESPTVVSTDWKKFDFVLQPLEGDYDWLTLEAWYVSDFGAPYNGNILLDNLSRIEMIVRE